MKICTITCHDVYNYGASLQAFALQHYLEKQGHDVNIIDYKPEYQPTYGFRINVSRDSVHYKKYQKYPILKVIKGIKEYCRSISTRGRIKAFAQFNKDYLHLTRHYDTFNQLAEFPPQADAYIAGSDQIWSTKLSNGSDPAFYMKFGSPETRRIAYAASFAYPEVYYGKDELVKALLTNIDCISVRELTGVELLQKLGYKGVHVFDPVFLLSMEDWTKAFALENKSTVCGENYILVYDLKSNTPEMRKKALELKSKLGCKVIAINNRSRTPYADININNASPVDFVRLMSGAKAIIADSFHATAFSVIFHKPFWTYYKAGNIARMENMLTIVGLDNRLNADIEIEDPDWNKVQSILDTCLSDSKAFLNTSLGK